MEVKLAIYISDTDVRSSPALQVKSLEVSAQPPRCMNAAKAVRGCHVARQRNLIKTRNTGGMGAGLTSLLKFCAHRSQSSLRLEVARDTRLGY